MKKHKNHEIYESHERHGIEQKYENHEKQDKSDRCQNELLTTRPHRKLFTCLHTVTVDDAYFTYLAYMNY